MSSANDTVILYRSQRRTFKGMLKQQNKTLAINLTGKTVDYVHNTMAIPPVITVTDAVNGEITIVIEALEDAVVGVFSFQVQIDGNTSNELQFPPLRVAVR